MYASDRDARGEGEFAPDTTVVGAEKPGEPWRLKPPHPTFDWARAPHSDSVHATNQLADECRPSVPEVGSGLLRLLHCRQELVGFERAAGLMGEGEQAVTEIDLALELALDESEGLDPSGPRLGHLDQAADGKVVDRPADRLAASLTRLGESAAALEHLGAHDSLCAARRLELRRVLHLGDRLVLPAVLSQSQRELEMRPGVGRVDRRRALLHAAASSSGASAG